MPSRKMTVQENTNNRIDRETKKYMESVYEFLKKNNDGQIPPEYNCSLLMLKSYYKQLLIFNDEIDHLDSYIVDTRYGKQPNALLKARDTTVQKLDLMLKALGLTFKEQTNMKIVQIKPTEDNPLQDFLKNNDVELR